MRLTNTLRDAFVRAVMDDVSSIDYDTLIREAVYKAAVERLPAAAYTLWTDPKTKGFVVTGRISVRCKSVANVPGVDNWNDLVGASPEEAKAFFAQFEGVIEQERDQSTARSALKDRVKGVAYSCTTHKALLEALPEFEKYLPAEKPKASGLPAVANLVSDLMAAGWPKGKEPAAA